MVADSKLGERFSLINIYEKNMKFTLIHIHIFFSYTCYIKDIFLMTKVSGLHWHILIYIIYRLLKWSQQ